MKNLLLIALFIVSTISLFAQGQDVEKEKELVKQVIQEAYVDGLCNNADEVAVDKGFHPGFNILGVGKGNAMWNYPIYNWIEVAKNGKHKYAFQDEFTTIKFQFVDVTGKAAVAKIDFYEGDEKKFVDYLSLLKFEDGWKIVTKTFYTIPKEEEESK